MTDTRTDGFVLTRVFDAPVDLVWRCFTEQAHLAKWSAPRGYTIPTGEGDVRVGGQWHCCMRAPDGTTQSVTDEERASNARARFTAKRRTCP